MKTSKKVQRPLAIKEEGARAYMLGRELTACPYPPNTEEYTLWTDGWCDKDDEFFETSQL